MDILSKDLIRLLRDKQVRERAQEIASKPDSDESATVTVQTDEDGSIRKTKVTVRRLST